MFRTQKLNSLWHFEPHARVPLLLVREYARIAPMGGDLWSPGTLARRIAKLPVPEDAVVTWPALTSGLWAEITVEINGRKDKFTVYG